MKVILASDEKTNPLFGNAFAAGCGAETATKYEGGAWAGFGSPQTWNDLTEARKKGEDFYYGDHAYFGRGKFFRVTKNALQYGPRWAQTGIHVPDFDRLALHGWKKEKPYQKGGGHIVLCPQSEGWHQRMGEPGWTERMLHTLSLYTDREIVQRTKKTSRPLAEDLQGAWALVTHTSNSAVEALLHGVPVFCTGDCAASHLALSDVVNIEKPFRPEGRLSMAAVLAANQWTLAEIAAGDAWRAVQ